MSLSQREVGLTKQKTADFLGVSVRQLHRYTEKGMPREGNGKKIRYGPAAFAWHREYVALQNPSRRTAGTLTEEQARKIRIEADRAQLKLVKEQGSLVQIGMVRAKIEEINGIITARLRRFAKEMAPLVTGRNKVEIKATLEAGVYEMLTDLSSRAKKRG